MKRLAILLILGIIPLQLFAQKMVKEEYWLPLLDVDEEFLECLTRSLKDDGAVFSEGKYFNVHIDLEEEPGKILIVINEEEYAANSKSNSFGYTEKEGAYLIFCNDYLDNIFQKTNLYHLFESYINVKVEIVQYYPYDPPIWIYYYVKDTGTFVKI